MDIHHLKIFISVHRNNSFSKASQELNISQPTISEHIKNLEAELNCSLFDRLGRSIIPTDRAEILLPHALQVVEEMTKLKEAIHQDNQNIHGDIIITASTIPGTYLLPKIAAVFKDKHPQTRFQILINDTATSAAKVASHEIHLAVTGGPGKNNALEEKPFLEDQLVCVASPTCINKGTQDIRGLPILIREKGSGTRLAMEDIFREGQIPLKKRNITATLGSTAAIKEALVAGLGISIISLMAVEEELKAGTLQKLELPVTTMTRPIICISHRKRTLPRRYQAFIDMMFQRTAR